MGALLILALAAVIAYAGVFFLAFEPHRLRVDEERREVVLESRNRSHLRAWDIGTHGTAIPRMVPRSPELGGGRLAIVLGGSERPMDVAAFDIDRLNAGPVWTTAVTFAARIAVFGLIAVDQSPLSIAIFALVFGATFLVTAPLTVLFVLDHFGMAHLGALTGLITMVHQIFGGIGAYGGALIFDATGSYDAAFIVMLAASALALVLTLMVRRAPP
jgi:hypothetical protein